MVRPVLTVLVLAAIFCCLATSAEAKGIPCVKEYENDGYALHATFSGTSMHVEVDSGAQAALALKNGNLKEKYNQRLIRFANDLDLSLTAESNDLVLIKINRQGEIPGKKPRISPINPWLRQNGCFFIFQKIIRTGWQPISQ